MKKSKNEFEMISRYKILENKKKNYAMRNLLYDADREINKQIKNAITLTLLRYEGKMRRIDKKFIAFQFPDFFVDHVVSI